MKTKIELSDKDYALLCDIATAKGKSVEDTLMELLEEFTKAEISKVKIKNIKKNNTGSTERH